MIWQYSNIQIDYRERVNDRHTFVESHKLTNTCAITGKRCEMRLSRPKLILFTDVKSHMGLSIVVKDCQTMFNFRRVSELVLDRKRKFLQKLCSSDNICETLSFMAKDELSNLRSAS